MDYFLHEICIIGTNFFQEYSADAEEKKIPFITLY